MVTRGDARTATWLVVLLVALFVLYASWLVSVSGIWIGLALALVVVAAGWWWDRRANPPAGRAP